MTTYKDFPQVQIGSSDIASLTVRFPVSAFALNFGEDGTYSAYLVTEEAEIGAHYSKVCEGTDWVKIYDDEGLALEVEGQKIEIYRAGMQGCIIRVIGAR